MKKISQIVLEKFLALFLALFLIVSAIVYYWVYEFYLHSSKEALMQATELVSFTINKDTDLDALAKKVKKQLHLRLTIIDEEGNILAESDKDKHTMDNHKYRDEIIQANREKHGYIIRRSHTLDKDLQYVAKKYTIDGKVIFVRVAREIKGVRSEIINLGIKIAFVLLLFFLIVLYMSYKINIQIQHETKRIVDFLKSLTKKKKNTYIKSDFSQEFFHITNLLTKVSQILVKKEKQKTKYTQKLQKLNEQKDDIISAISHEFKNPIAVVNGYSQTLLDDENINPSIRKKFLTKIYTNGTKLSELIDTLRLSMKLDGGHQALNTRKVNLYNLVQEAAQNLGLHYKNKKIIINGDKALTIDIDPTLFGIVITNLIENAFKYSEDEVIVNISQNSLEVIDTGIGISEKDLQNITNKFYRVHSNRWNNSLGLGLFLVNNIIQLHNFKLVIKSKLNEGSSFTIVF
ncbi:sensor histidine kinase [Sulfurimonas sp. SWIR-19]|uniref:sensor histidine kinase n=1 Tax=Sulfurimonas sp. SWIR-19 TaxID=2878390 RepID=UPI001CF1D6B8|nr:ATP-binding protein [Sulfurimonas sp. SWIR-19]UCM99959.1 sensor histidine kinase [Sulfurimonas sp. SWIR-19]